MDGTTEVERDRVGEAPLMPSAPMDSERMADTSAYHAALQEATRRGYVAAFRWLHDRDEARDAVHEAVAKALVAKHRYDASRPFYPWFYRILKNHCLDRRARRRRGDEAADRWTHEGGRSYPAAEQLLLRDERERAVVAAIERLAEEHREIIELRHFQDLSYQEMAEVLSCPIGTVMSRLYRARQQLRQILVEPGGPFAEGRRS